MKTNSWNGQQVVHVKNKYIKTDEEHKHYSATSWYQSCTKKANLISRYVEEVEEEEDVEAKLSSFWDANKLSNFDQTCQSKLASAFAIGRDKFESELRVFKEVRAAEAIDGGDTRCSKLN